MPEVDAGGGDCYSEAVSFDNARENKVAILLIVHHVDRDAAPAAVCGDLAVHFPDSGRCHHKIAQHQILFAVFPAQNLHLAGSLLGLRGASALDLRLRSDHNYIFRKTAEPAHLLQCDRASADDQKCLIGYIRR